MPGNATLNVLIGDDHIVIYEGLSAILQASIGSVTIGYAHDVASITSALQERQHDLLMLDINLQGTNALESIDSFREVCPGLKIIVFSSYNNRALVDKARERKADAYLLKNCDSRLLLTTIERVIAGEDCFGVQFDNRLYAANDHFVTRDRLKALTGREQEIAQFIISGYAEQDICDKLFISKHTVRTHKKNIYRKLKVSGSSGLIKYVQGGVEVL